MDKHQMTIEQRSNSITFYSWGCAIGFARLVLQYPGPGVGCHVISCEKLCLWASSPEPRAEAVPRHMCRAELLSWDIYPEYGLSDYDAVVVIQAVRHMYYWQYFMIWPS